MDTFEPFKIFSFDNFEFHSRRYEEYIAGKLIASGNVDIMILCTVQNDNNKKSGEVIKTYLIRNSIKDKIVSEFEFDVCITLNDRMQLTIFPKETNVNDTIFIFLKQIMEYTRNSKHFSNNEPIVGNIFTENMNIKKIVFKMTNPERIIEFT